MIRPSLFRKLCSVVFATAIMFTVSVSNVHYLFAQHETHEHCENHLHSTEHHDDCSVCKFDVSLFTDAVIPIHQATNDFSIDKEASAIQYLNLQSSLFHLPKRGPPALD